MSSTLYLVAPASLRLWFADFVRIYPSDEICFLGEEEPLHSASTREAMTAAAAFDRVVILSGHHSLRRDLSIAELLRSAGVEVHAQSARAAGLGLDKVEFKRFLDRHGFPTAAWGTGEGVVRASEARPLVVKERHGTQSRNIRLGTAELALARHQYWETFVGGVEYSVLVYVEPTRTVSFPPVWKGETSRDLLPPWRRVRVCPAPALTPQQAATLAELATEVCLRSEARGYVEVEFIQVGGETLVLEINPRVSGVMRISALAAATPLFPMHADATLGRHLPPRRVAVEVPYEGRPYVLPERGVYATSRLTVAGDDVDEISATLADLLGPANVPSIPCVPAT